MGVATGRVAICTAGLVLQGARSACAGGHIEPRPFLGDSEEIPMPGVGENSTPPFASVSGRRIPHHYFAGGETSKGPSGVLRWSFTLIEIGAPGKITASLRSAPPVARDAAIRKKTSALVLVRLGSKALEPTPRFAC